MYSLRLPAILTAISLLTNCFTYAAIAAPVLGTPVAATPPDYASRLRHHATWTAFPLTIAFVRDANYRPQREQWARRGFDAWFTATRGIMGYRVIADSIEAQITIRFDPATNNGYTYTSFRDGQIGHADIRIGVRRGRGADAACIAAHEFAHALGVDAHSSDPRDLMYPVHYMGRAWRITPRDYNTLAVLYPALRP